MLFIFLAQGWIISNLLNFAVINFREFAKFCSRKIALISLFAELNIRQF